MNCRPKNEIASWIFHFKHGWHSSNLSVVSKATKQSNEKNKFAVVLADASSSNLPLDDFLCLPTLTILEVRTDAKPDYEYT